MTPNNSRQTNSLLGYPADARLLIINTDDFGMCRSINDAIIRTLTDGPHSLVQSATLMMPCPWVLHAKHWLGLLHLRAHARISSEGDAGRIGDRMEGAD
jgi:hypothetical protein